MENWRLSTYQNIQPTREVPTERYHAGYTVKKMANSVDPTYCMHMVPPNFLMHAVSHAWWGGLWFSEQAFADTVQKVLLCFDGGLKSWSGWLHLGSIVETWELWMDKLWIIDGHFVLHTLNWSRAMPHTMLSCDLIGWPACFMLTWSLTTGITGCRLQLEVLLSVM
jgi:hypothetical protein